MRENQVADKKCCATCKSGVVTEINESEGFYGTVHEIKKTRVFGCASFHTDECQRGHELGKYWEGKD